MKKAYHPDKKSFIIFKEKYHQYIDNLGVSYTSGTTFIKPFFPKFDMIAMSEKCATGDNPKYAGRNPEEIRAEWKAEGERGSSEGDNTHEYAEGIMAGWDTSELPKPISERCMQLFKQVDKIAAWLKSKYQFIEAEKIVFSPHLGIAGMVDLIMLDPATQEILILDWKTNKTLTIENVFQAAKTPISHLPDTHISKYTLQISLYEQIMVRENYFPCATGFRRALIHITPTAAIPIKLESYSYEIKELINHVKTN